jgi:hypothetical protein
MHVTGTHEQTLKSQKGKGQMEQELIDKLPYERPYLLCCSEDVLELLGLFPVEGASQEVALIGRGEVGARAIDQFYIQEFCN